MRFILGLTGPTGAGKSECAAVAANLGFQVIDCDKVAREATEKGSSALIELTKVFGTDILNADGTLNRQALANKAFKTPENTELLNKTVLPFIAELIKSRISGKKVLLDAPTLFESGIDGICNKTVAVLSDTENRLLRIKERDKIDDSAAWLRINAGKNDEYYLSKADKCFYNNGDLDLFKNDFKKYLTELSERN